MARRLVDVSLNLACILLHFLITFSLFLSISALTVQKVSTRLKLNIKKSLKAILAAPTLQVSLQSSIFGVYSKVQFLFFNFIFSPFHNAPIHPLYLLSS